MSSLHFTRATTRSGARAPRRRNTREEQDEIQVEAKALEDAADEAPIGVGGGPEEGTSSFAYSVTALQVATGSAVAALDRAAWSSGSLRCSLSAQRGVALAASFARISVRSPESGNNVVILSEAEGPRVKKVDPTGGSSSPLAAFGLWMTTPDRRLSTLARSVRGLQLGGTIRK